MREYVIRVYAFGKGVPFAVIHCTGYEAFHRIIAKAHEAGFYCDWYTNNYKEVAA